MVDGIQEVSGKIGRPPTMLFSWEDQTSICSAFDAVRNEPCALRMRHGLGMVPLTD